MRLFGKNSETGGDKQDCPDCSAFCFLFLLNGDTPVRDILTGLNANEFAADIDFLCDYDSEAGCSTSTTNAC
jgi:hypothetical protein